LEQGKSFAERILTHLERLGMSKYRLAVMSGIPHSTLLSILSGKAESPSIQTASKIAKALGLTTSQLLGEDEVDDVLNELREENERLREKLRRLECPFPVKKAGLIWLGIKDEAEVPSIICEIERSLTEAELRLMRKGIDCMIKAKGW
jgi:transcriptional regulator with XRE-family HTH domain